MMSTLNRLCIALWIMSIAGCAVGPRFLKVSENGWRRFSDLERITAFQKRPDGLWAISSFEGKSTSIVHYVERGEAAMFLDASSPEQADRAIWIEEVGLETLSAFLLSREQGSEGSAAASPHTGPASSAPTTQRLHDPTSPEQKGEPTPEIEIEDAGRGADQEIEIEGEEGSKEVDLEIEIDGEAEPEEASDDGEIEIADDEAGGVSKAQAPPPQSTQQIRGFIIYVAGSSGLWARGLAMNSRSIELSPRGRSPQWIQLSASPVSHLVHREEGGAWWGGQAGMGWIEKGEIHAVSSALKVRQLVKVGPRLLVLNSLGDLLWKAKEGDQLERTTCGCEGEILAISGPPFRNMIKKHTVQATDDEEAIAICATGGVGAARWRSGEWLTYQGSLPIPQDGRLEAWDQGWIYRSRGQWMWLKSAMIAQDPTSVGATTQAATSIISGNAQPSEAQESHSSQEESTPSHEPTRKTGDEQTEASGPVPQRQAKAEDRSVLYATNLKGHGLSWEVIGALQVDASQRVTQWGTFEENQGSWMVAMIAHQGIKRWSWLNGEGAPRSPLISKSLTYHDQRRPFWQDSQGRLSTLVSRGIIREERGEWSHLPMPHQLGRLMGYAACDPTPYWIGYRHGEMLLSANDQSEPMIFDLSAQTFREGLPSLGEVSCSRSGDLIFANLFWSQGRPRMLGVGLLVIDLKAKQAEVWERRQGYDGEEDISPTPLLPHSVFNSITPFDQDHVYISTDSGLAFANPRASKRMDKLKVWDEASGWATEFFSGLTVQLGKDQRKRIWVATPRGLAELIEGRLRLWIKGMTTAVSTGKDEALWVSIGGQLWRGEGEGDLSWSRASFQSELGDDVGTVSRLFPRPDGGIYIITNEATFSSALKPQ